MNGILTQALPFLLIFVVFYFLLIRPQQKRQRERTSMLSDLKQGQRVVTIGGINGKIVELNDETITLLVSETTQIVFERSAIANVKKED
ncbi:MAG TPA: preprotein translocase subunit YajC [Bacilli bacterium]|nr:preprotein translocase subunit YajC [Bacilli bacterium]